MPIRAVLVAIGANLPGVATLSPLETCRNAVAEMDALPAIQVKGLSHWYETSPVPPSGQPPYINAVAHLAIDAVAAIDPDELLRCLFHIEASWGRQRSFPNAARTLDLDLIAVRDGLSGDVVCNTPTLVLPHPRAHERAFVLMPLRDVAPHWVHPVLGLDVATLIARLPPQPLGSIRMIE